MNTYKTVFRLSALIVFLCFSGQLLVFAGKPFEGIITFKITYPDNKFSESQMAMFPKTMILYIKGNLSRSELPMSGASSTEIKNHLEKNSTTLLDAMGQKFAIRENPADIDKAVKSFGTVTIENSGETKQIAGHNCKKAIVHHNDKGIQTSYEVYFTNELGLPNANFDVPLYKDIEGVLLEYIIVSGEIRMKYTAASVEKKGLPSKDFEIPSDYKPITKEELNSIFGGGNE